jgi:hypothetical protein
VLSSNIIFIFIFPFTITTTITTTITITITITTAFVFTRNELLDEHLFPRRKIDYFFRLCHSHHALCLRLGRVDPRRKHRNLQQKKKNKIECFLSFSFFFCSLLLRFVRSERRLPDLSPSQTPLNTNKLQKHTNKKEILQSNNTNKQFSDQKNTPTQPVIQSIDQSIHPSIHQP